MALFKSKGSIVGALLIGQLVLLIGGEHYYHAHPNLAPQNVQYASKKQSGHVSYVDANKDAHRSSTGYLKEQNVSAKSYGSYLKTIPPLDKTLRDYYQIDIIVNVQPNHIYQQFAMTPKKKVIPVKVQKRLDTSTLLRAVRHYNVQSKRQRTTQHSHSYTVTFNRLKYDQAYNWKSEQYHFIHSKPFVIPPVKGKSTSHADVTFTEGSLTSNGITFNKIPKSQAKRIIGQSKTSLQSVGY